MFVYQDSYQISILKHYPYNLDSEEDIIKLNKPLNLHLYYLLFYYLK